MKDLSENGIYKVNENIINWLKDFYGNYATSEEVYKAISDVYNEEGYLIDTHTAVAYAVLNKYISETNDKTPCLIVSTASPYKFPRSIVGALGLEVQDIDDFEVIEKLYNFSKVKIPLNLKGLNNKEVIHRFSCESNEFKKPLLDFLGVSND